MSSEAEDETDGCEGIPREIKGKTPYSRTVGV